MDAYVGERISARRTALGLSQSALGQRLGVSFQQVQKYENGSNRVSATRLHAIATLLGTSIGDFFPDTPRQAGAVVEIDRSTASLRLMTASTEGREVAEAFPAIADRSVRQAVAIIVRTLSEVG